MSEQTKSPMGIHTVRQSSHRERLHLVREGFDEEDIHHLDAAITDIVGRDGCTGVPGLAYLRNKVAARVGATLIETGGE